VPNIVIIGTLFVRRREVSQGFTVVCAMQFSEKEGTLKLLLLHIY